MAIPRADHQSAQARGRVRSRAVRALNLAFAAASLALGAALVAFLLLQGAGWGAGAWLGAALALHGLARLWFARRR